MFRSLWFFIKLAFIIGAAVWIAERPGQVVFNWMGYHIETSIGIVLILLFVLIIASAFLYNLWKGFLSMPSKLRQHSQTRAKEKGYAALTKGLVAIAAGDKKTARKQAKKASKLLPNTALTKLLSAQSALMNNKDDQAMTEFYELMQDEEAGFLGLRGLLTQTMRQGNHEAALSLVRKAETLQPKAAWVLQTLLDLEIQARDWSSAEKTLYKAFKNNVFDKATFKKHNIAIALAKAEIAHAKGFFDISLEQAREAWRLNTSFVPAIIAYTESLQGHGDHKKAVKVFSRAWKENDHRDLAKLWFRLSPSDIRHGGALKKMEWAEKLYHINKKSNEGALQLALCAMEAGVWGQSRTILSRLAKEAPNERVFLALSDLEQRENQDQNKANQWMKKALDCPTENEWFCHHCAAQATRWSPICGNCGSFDTIEWGKQHFSTTSPHRLRLGNHEGFIEPPTTK